MEIDSFFIKLLNTPKINIKEYQLRIFIQMFGIPKDTQILMDTYPKLNMKKANSTLRSILSRVRVNRSITFSGISRWIGHYIIHFGESSKLWDIVDWKSRDKIIKIRDIYSYQKYTSKSLVQFKCIPNIITLRKIWWQCVRPVLKRKGLCIHISKLIFKQCGRFEKY